MDSTGAREHKVAGPRAPAARWWWCAGICAVVALTPTGGAALAGTLPSPGCLAGGEPARIVSVSNELTFGLADGRTILLPGLDPVRAEDADGAGAARQAVVRWLEGQTVDVRPLSPEPDRWGRVPALLFAAAPNPDGPAGTATKVSVAEAVIDAGLARARPDVRIAPCWPVFLGLERGARAAGLGLWREPRYAVIGAEDRARLLAATGRMAIVEGNVVRVSEGRARTYLAFGANRADFTLTVAKPILARLRAAGVDPAGWQGRHLRVRGLLDDRFGLQIEMTSADQIEFTGPL